jgi:hypothetical protein
MPDIRKAIAEGDVLLVSTPEDVLGRFPSALIGCAMLGLVGEVTQEMMGRAASERIPTTVMISELQGYLFDYPWLMSDTRKIGGNMVMSTRNLSGLGDDRDALISNISDLSMFQGR